MKRRTWIKLALTGIPLALSGCGFRLRGSVVDVADPGAVFIDISRGVTLRTDLEAALQERSFRIAPNRDEADVLIRISNETRDERILSVESSGNVSELELSHSVDMQVAKRSSDAELAYDPEQLANRVEVFRDYTNDIGNVLGKQEEARILREELREELVRQVVLRAVVILVNRSAVEPV